MGDINLLIIMLNVAYLIFLGAFVCKKIVWLRSLAIGGYIMGCLLYTSDAADE